MLKQSPMISGSIIVKNLSFEGKMIIKALLEQGINVDIEGENLRIGSKNITAKNDSFSQLDGKTPKEKPYYSENLDESNYCPFYSKIEHFSRKIDSLNEILKNKQPSRDFSRNERSDNGIFMKTSPSYYDNQQTRPDQSFPERNPVWPLPRDDLQKTNDFLERQKSGTDFPSFFDGETENGKKSCKHCGLQLSKNSFFCNQCGNEI